MLKILIVDDEAPTRMRIIKGIDWEEFNISQIIQAEDGEEARICAIPSSLTSS